MDGPLRSRPYGWYVLFVLAGLNFLNYATRNVVVTMYPELRAAFGWDDAQLGWLTSSFIIAHAVMNVPFGWLADRLDRRRVLAVGAVIWALAGLGEALAGSYSQMIAARVLAGIGTASCVPIANALLCDVFPADRKARTVAVLNIGLFVGGAAGIVMGQWPGFPTAFVAIGVPSAIFAALVATLDVPPGRQSIAAPSLDMGWRAGAINVRAIVAVPTFRRMQIGGIGAAFAAGGFIAWFADFLDKEKGFTPDEAVTTLGVIAFTGGLAGVIAGGLVADRLMKWRVYGRLAAIALGFAASVPMALAAIYLPRGPGFYAAAWCLMFFVNWYHAPMAAGVDDVVADERASLAQALFIFFMHLLGTAAGPVLVGELSEATSLSTALLAPTAALVLASVAFASGCVTVADDSADSC